MRNQSQLRAQDRQCGSGFTLIELLVVIVIMVVILTLVIASFGGVLESTNLTGAGTIVVGEIDLARQTALSQVQEVEVRFLQLPDSQGNVGPYYRGVQLFRVSDGAAIDKLQVLPAPIVIMDGSTSAFSSIFASISSSSTLTLPTGANAPYKAIDFKAGGGTTLAATASGGSTWFLTLKSQNAPAVGTTAPAKNFITIQIDPVSGRTQIFQP